MQSQVITEKMKLDRGKLSDKSISVEEAKAIFDAHIDTFISMRNRECNGEELADDEGVLYVFLVDNILLPTLQVVHESGDEIWVRENEFSYEY